MQPQNAMQLHMELTEYFRSQQDTIRGLIGSEHWPTDGAHKEFLVRKVLRDRLPAGYRVGQGFVSLPIDNDAQRVRRSSGQLDILVIHQHTELLYGEGDLFIVRPEDALAVLEVKTTLPVAHTSRRNSGMPRESALRSVLIKTANRAERIRSSSPQPDHRACWVGLFVYNAPPAASTGRYHEQLLHTLQDITGSNLNRVINCIALGPNVFVRYWPNSQAQVRGPVNGPAWHSYVLRDLAQPYLLSNLIVPFVPYWHDDDQVEEYFPIRGGKENMRRYVAPLDSDIVMEFGL